MYLLSIEHLLNAECCSGKEMSQSKLLFFRALQSRRAIRQLLVMSKVESDRSKQKAQFICMFSLKIFE
jgi:hypothetical protein